MPHVKMVEGELSGWGLYPRVHCRSTRPRSVDETAAALRGGGIARGLGRSYGDPALTESGVVIDMTAQDAYLAFDEERGELTCQAGVSLQQIIDTFAPRGWFPPITPGTKFVTLGGCVANDIHGKAHHVDGCFSTCVRSMRVLLADGTVVAASREERPDLFWGCFGGMGLLGIVVEVTIQLRRIETTYFHQRVHVANNLAEMIEAFDRTAHDPYSVAWIDPLATGDKLGRGVLTTGESASVDALPARYRKRALVTTPPSPVKVPFELPSWTLNQATIRVLNVVLDQVLARGSSLAHYEKFFFPLDFIGEWNRGYGPRGFTQYQFVIPLDHGAERMRELLEVIATSGQLPFLNVLKRFGPENPDTQLSFPFEGYTFAIDFPIRDGLLELTRRLDAMVLDAGGRIYLGKDAFVDAPTLEAMYEKLPRWREVKAKYDPDEVFRSSLSARVGLTRS